MHKKTAQLLSQPTLRTIFQTVAKRPNLLFFLLLIFFREFGFCSYDVGSNVYTKKIQPFRRYIPDCSNVSKCSRQPKS